MRARPPPPLCRIAVIALLLLAGCDVAQLPPPEAPRRLVPADVDVPLEPPSPGTGRVIIETNGERAKVVEITGHATAWAGGESANIIGVRPLCTTPCVVDLPYGLHPLVLRSVDDEARQSEAELEVGSRARVFRHTLGERSDGGGLRTAGATLLTLGLIAATAGALMWVAGSSTADGSQVSATGQLVTGTGAGGVLLSIPFLFAGRPTERPGATTQWMLPARSSSPSIPRPPEAAALDRL